MNKTCRDCKYAVVYDWGDSGDVSVRCTLFLYYIEPPFKVCGRFKDEMGNAE